MPKNIAKEIDFLYDTMYNEISLNRCGAKLPSFRTMLQKYDCSRQVLTRTLEKLRKNGVVKIRERIGIFANIKNDRRRKNIVFVHIDWVCEMIKYFGDELEKYFDKKPDYNFQQMTFSPGGTNALIEKMKKVDADLIILTLEYFDFEVCRQLNEFSDRIIFFLNSPRMEKINAIDFQPCMAGMMAAQHLIDLGHRQIALILSEPILFTSREHVYGFLDYLKLQNIKPKLIDCKIQSGVSAAGLTRDFMTEYLKHNPVDFTACFTLSDATAAAVADALLHRGIKIPEEVSIIGYGGASIAAENKYDLCSVSLDFSKIVQTAIKAIEQFFMTGKCGVKRISPILIRRNSTRSITTKKEVMQ